jgi:GH24 family phage-related lysozyme (muramidase)
MNHKIVITELQLNKLQTFILIDDILDEPINEWHNFNKKYLITEDKSKVKDLSDKIIQKIIDVEETLQSPDGVRLIFKNIVQQFSNDSDKNQIKYLRIALVALNTMARRNILNEVKDEIPKNIYNEVTTNLDSLKNFVGDKIKKLWNITKKGGKISYKIVKGVINAIIAIENKIKSRKHFIQFAKYIIKKIAGLSPKTKMLIIQILIASGISFYSINIYNDIKEDVPTEITKEEISFDFHKAMDFLQSKIQKITTHEIPNKPSDTSLNLIKSFETLVLKAYAIGDGMITIGWGHAEYLRTSKYKVGDTITKEEADALFEDDVQDRIKLMNAAIAKWPKEAQNKLTQSMYDALFSMWYNIGDTKFPASSFWKLMSQGKTVKAAKLIPNYWVGRSGSKFNKGLRKRRVAEYKVFIQDGI